MAKPKQPTARQRRTEAEHKVATLTAHAEALALEKSIALMESPQPVVVPWADYPAFDQFGQWPTGYERPYLWSGPEDRTEGRYRPYYETDQDLRVMRATARRFQALFPVAEGALEALTNYVIGEGFEITAQPKRKEQREDPNVQALCKVVQKVVDRFLEYNEFAGNLDREIHTQSRTDGESFLTLYPEERDVRIDLVSPDYILQPVNETPLNRMLGQGHKLNYWWLGVHTQHCPRRKRDDTAKPLGYHAVFDRTGDQWDYLPSSRVEHIKLNVGSDARRGVSDFYIVQKDLEAEAKIRRNTAEGAAILAAIVMIREHAEGVSKSSIESMVSTSATNTTTRYVQGGTRNVNSENVRAGTVKDIPHGMKAMMGPMGTLNQPVYIEVDKHLQRVIWQRWNAPDFMTGDASAQNYATALVSEAPFVKARENDQRSYGRHFERLIWKALRIYHECGCLGQLSFQQLFSLVKLKFDYPEVASRDKAQQAEVATKLNDLGVISKRTIASEFGYDFDEEQQEIKKEPKTEKPQPMGFGSPFGARPIVAAPPEVESRLESLAAAALKRITESA